MNKYNISKQFKAISNFKPPVNRFTIFLSKLLLHAPLSMFLDKDLKVKKHKIEAFNKGKIKLYEIYPKNIKNNAPCLIYYHGGGFVMPASPYHYKLACQYAKQLNAKVIFVNYRLAPKYKIPYQVEDSYCALKWTQENAKNLNIDISNIGVGGDSAGGTIAAGVCLITKDRNPENQVKFQMLVYPFLDKSMSSESAKKFTDTPMWNSKLSEKASKLIMPKEDVQNEYYFSPVEAPDFKNLPSAYIETAEFDSLHDDGIKYKELLETSGVKVVLNETKQTMHGFDMILKAQITKDAVKQRINFMKNQFEN